MLSVVQALSLLTPFEIDRLKVRLGPAADGGYVFADGITPDQTVISYGISTEYQFDAEMAERGHDVFMFDHTIDGIERSHAGMHWFKEGVAGVSDPAASLFSVADHLDMHGVAGDRLILKMDVEGAEFDAIGLMPAATLRRFEQIVFEIHGLAGLADATYRASFVRMLSRLNATHTLFHVHANNYDGPDTLHAVEGVPVSNLLELSYVRSDGVRRSPSRTLYPTHLDFPNVGTRDRLLWHFPFLPTDLPVAAFEAGQHRNRLVAETLLLGGNPG